MRTHRIRTSTRFAPLGAARLIVRIVRRIKAIAEPGAGQGRGKDHCRLGDADCRWAFMLSTPLVGRYATRRTSAAAALAADPSGAADVRRAC